MAEGISRISLSDFHQNSNAMKLSSLEPDDTISQEAITSDQVQEKLVSIFHQSFTKLEKLWKTIGFEKSQRSKRSHMLLYHMETVFLQIVSEEEDLLSRIEENVKLYSEEICQLCEELRIEQHEPNESLARKELETVLRLKVGELLEEKERRMEKFTELKEQEIPLCARLRMPSYTLDVEKIPSVEELKEMAQHILMLNEQKNLRFRKFTDLKLRISNVLEDMEMLPTSSLEKDVVNGHEDSVILSQDMMANYKELLHELEEKKLANERSAQKLRKRLSILWQCLKMDEEERSEFLAKNQGYKLSTIERLQDEISRCEMMKQQNIKGFVQNARDRLKELWKICCIPEETMVHLLADESYTELWLDTHENEVMKWQEYYDEHSEILSFIKQLETSWDDVKEFEGRPKDPNRLLNRGGALLQEERERRKLERDILVIEKILLKRASEYETCGHVFNVWGKSVPEYIKELRDAYNILKKKQLDERRRSPVISPSKRHLVDTAEPPTQKKLKFGTHLRVSGESPPTSDGSGSTRKFRVSPKHKKKTSRVVKKSCSPAKSPAERAPSWKPISPSAACAYTDFKDGVPLSSTVVVLPRGNSSPTT